MGHALAQRGFSSTATCPISQQSTSSSSAAPASVNPKTSISTVSAGPSTVQVQRGYASIAAVEAAALERATSPSSPQPSFVNSASIGDNKDIRTPAQQGHAQGRPTCALGFAKHVITSHRPGFDFEAFYEAELDKKHKDKSYRVRLDSRCGQESSPDETDLLSLTFCSTSTTSTGSFPLRLLSLDV